MIPRCEDHSKQAGDEAQESRAFVPARGRHRGGAARSLYQSFARDGVRSCVPPPSGDARAVAVFVLACLWGLVSLAAGPGPAWSMTPRKVSPARAASGPDFPAPPLPPPPSPPPLAPGATPAELADPRGTLYTIATAHLDTQWRWTIRETIEKHIPATLRTNLDFFEKYPDYTFSFEGAFRYQLAREYYPEEFERMRRAIATGRWRPTGSWVDAVDTNLPSPESLVRHVLYGNGYFRREFGCTSKDVFLPDCFGFGAALPAVAAHCGLLGFSSQKLTWGSAAGLPFDLGVWEGVDGSSLVAALNPGAYVGRIESDLSADSAACAAVAREGASSGVYAAVRYFGTGDTGGGPTEESVQWLERSLRGAGPLRVLSAPGDQFARDLSTPGAAGLRARLPRYRGELLMTRHGSGCYTSEAAMKRMNRRNESLADAAERAAVAAHLLGAMSYPREALRENQVRFLWHQFHDDLTGTSIPEAYAYSWNDERISENRLAAIAGDAVGGVTRGLDTRVTGVPIVVYNPLSIEREDVVDALLPWPETAGSDAPYHWGRPPGLPGNRGPAFCPVHGFACTGCAAWAGRAIRVFDPDGEEVPAQIQGGDEDGLRIAFLARVPSMGFAVYDLQLESGEPARGRRNAPETSGDLAVGPGVLANARYRVRLDDGGDVASIVDRADGRELLRAPLRLQLIDDEPEQWPAWEIDYADLMAAPRAVVGGPAQVRIVEAGPARVALEVTRHAGGSTFVQTIRLGAGGAADRVDIETRIDWRTPGTLLKAAFPLAPASEEAVYDLGIGVMRRGTNTPRLYEVPAQKWAALPSPGGASTVAVLNDCRYGWDHPDSSTLRLSLLHTPRVNAGWNWVNDEGTQDLGRHTITYAICAAPGAAGTSAITWQAERLNRPLIAVVAPAHGGALGRRFSGVQVSAGRSGRIQAQTAPPVIVRACKLAEEDGSVILRLQELDGETASSGVFLPWPVRSVREVNGAEEPFDPSLPSLSPAHNTEPPILDPATGIVRVSFGPWQLRTLCLEVDRSADPIGLPSTAPCDLPFDLRGITLDGEPGGAFDPQGGAIASEILPAIVDADGIRFRTGPRVPGMANVLACRGQRIDLPRGRWNRLYLLAASVGGDRRADLGIDGQPRTVRVQDWAEPVGSWDDRLADGKLVTDAALITPAFVKPGRLGWIGTHRHDGGGANLAYAVTPLCRLRIDLPRGAKQLVLPVDPSIRVLAVTVARNDNDAVPVVTPLVDEAPVTAVRIETPTSGFLESTDVRLASPDPGAVIRYTLDGTDPGRDASLYVAPLRIDRDCTLKARAFRAGRNDRFVAVRTFRRLVPRPAVAAAGTLEPGLAFRYYEGEWDRLPDFAALPVVGTGSVSAVQLPSVARPENFGVELRGYLRLPADGVYLFSLRSDDGSRFYLDDALTVDSDGLHGLGDERQEIALAAGLHRLRVEMFQRGGDRDLQLWIAGPGLTLQPVLPDMLWREGGEPGK